MPNRSDLLAMLREASFFSGLDNGMLDLLVDHATLSIFDSGSYLLRDGEPADALYVIRHGQVAIELAGPRDDPLVLQTLDEGDVVGWSSLVPPYTRNFDARARSLVRALRLDGLALRTLIDENHELGYQIMKQYLRVLGSRLTATRLQMLDLYATGTV